MQEEYQKRYDNLNTAQKQAVDTIEGPVLVIAGPGSGKTELLSMRVATILLQTDTSPRNILCLTFTDNAAIAMRKRLVQIIGAEAYKVAIHTFHGFGSEIINHHPEYFYGGASFVAADELMRTELLETVFDALSHDNPLASRHPEQGYVYLKDVLRAIGELKKAGLTPEEFLAIIEHNERVIETISEQVDVVFSKTIDRRHLEPYWDFIQYLEHISEDDFPAPYLSTFTESLSQSVKSVLLQVEESEKGALLSDWKKDMTVKDNDGRRTLKNKNNTPQLKALSEIYTQYQKIMFEKAYYDFDDMLLETIKAVENNQELRFELQEQYQYLLVDEFQDTNDAQMRLLRLIAEAEVNEGRPNLMAVGDDDQAIFKFQGAEVANILNFKKITKDPLIVVLTQNYRSTQKILDLARGVIVQGEERLENILPGVEKVLQAANSSLGAGGIYHQMLPSRFDEYYFIASEIRRLIDAGQKPEEIAIIGRRHQDLERLVPYLYQSKIPVRYDRQRNVLDEPHIHQLIQISRFIVSMMHSKQGEADYLLPEILSYPFWGLNRSTIISLSNRAYKERKLWLECAEEELQQIVQVLEDIAVRATHEPVEYILESIMTETPFREYYFSTEKFQGERAEYLGFLSSLRVFIESLREYRGGSPLLLEDMLSFVDLHLKNKISITDKSQFVNANSAVQLLSSHASKGLEFETVFVLSCQEHIWVKGGSSNKIAFPVNLPLSPSKDSIDDKLRLFYVAITRAKEHLYLTSYEKDDKGKDSVKLQFISDLEPQKQETSQDPLNVLTAAWSSFYVPPFVDDENALLKPLIENYTLSVTHLNNFLDVSNAGPQVFLEQNLLRFPQPKSASGAFGSAIHQTIEQIYRGLKQTGEKPTSGQVLTWYENELLRQRLDEHEEQRFLKQGKDALTAYYAQKKDSFNADDEIEWNFSNQNVMIGEAHITGKIDKIIKLADKKISVHDFKTGKPAEDWKGSGDHEKVKLWKYRRQLLFYKLLVENSRDFSQKYTVSSGILEFIEPTSDNRIVDLELQISEEELTELSQLITIVFQKIQNLDFPDISHYEKNMKGNLQFEEDLLNGLI